MKPIVRFSAGIALIILSHSGLTADEPNPEIAGLEKAASDFVIAYNAKDAAAIASLFIEDGEICDITGTRITSGREAITALYEQIFSDAPQHIAIEVDSVRLVAPNLAVEDGTFHLTPADDETAPPRSTSYSAMLMKDSAGAWHIASTRSLKDVTEATGHLADLADMLIGEWTNTDPDGVRLDLAFGWDTSGKYLIGEMLTTAAAAEPQEGSIRIGWDASKQKIVSWMFDAEGGFTHGTWTAADTGWLISSEGTTADGEILSASQKLSTDGTETLIWAAAQRIVDGESIPDNTMRIVRRAPEPTED